MPRIFSVLRRIPATSWQHIVYLDRVGRVDDRGDALGMHPRDQSLKSGDSKVGAGALGWITASRDGENRSQANPTVKRDCSEQNIDPNQCGPRESGDGGAGDGRFEGVRRSIHPCRICVAT